MKYNTQKLIKQKNPEFFNAKLTENVGKPKELWNSLKTLGLASIKSPLINICLKTKGDITNFDDKKNANIFRKIFFFCTIANDLLANLPSISFRFGLNSVRQYYEKVLKYPKSKFKFNVVSEESVLKLLQDFDENKAAGLDNLWSTVLAKFISTIYNLSIKDSIFPSDRKIKKLKPLFKKDSKADPKNYRPVSLLPLVSKIIEKFIHDQT